jgi:hypothetical protein
VFGPDDDAKLHYHRIEQRVLRVKSLLDTCIYQYPAPRCSDVRFVSANVSQALLGTTKKYHKEVPQEIIRMLLQSRLYGFQ